LNFDIAVIGGGSAGLVVANAAAQFGERVVLFEKGDMGGECLNAGCVPSKALLAAAKMCPTASYEAAMDHVHGVIAALAPHDSQERFERLGVTVVRAAARFLDGSRLEAAGTTYSARRIVIATGSRPLIPAIRGLADVPYFTTETLFANRVLPSHLLIIGGGAIGVEMAQAHRRLGSNVTIVEASKVLGKEDADLSRVVITTLQSEGVKILDGVGVASVRRDGDTICLGLDDGRHVVGSHLFVAAGRQANIEGLDLDRAAITHDRRGVIVNGGLRTSNRRVYAAGDVAVLQGETLQFTHVAAQQAGLIVRGALFRLPVKFNRAAVPRVTYTDPELAQVGLTEADARVLQGDNVRVLTTSFTGNDRAQTDDVTNGLVKIIVGKHGLILGAGISGAHAGEQIAMWALAVSRKMKISSIATLVLPYPTLGEAGKRAAVSYYAPMPSKPWVRLLVGLLKRLG
jgi:pyruvate/2-oxoglutarate dehydrogenase complex dihydrolipoamide dehydrogenase (E3) component